MKKQIVLTVIFVFIFQCSSFGQGSAYCGPYVVKSPLKWDNVHNQTINKLKITNPSGHCIKLTNCSNITIINCKLGPSKNEGVYLYHCKNILITNCTMDSIDSGVVADGCTGIKITHNDVKNVQGPLPRGQMVQFGNVYGPGNCINYNVGENIFGQSYPEDEISLYMSNGTAKDPIQITGNWIRGGGPSNSGGGIMTGDKGGSYILVQDIYWLIPVNTELPLQVGIILLSGTTRFIQGNYHSAILVFQHINNIRSVVSQIQL